MPSFVVECFRRTTLDLWPGLIWELSQQKHVMRLSSPTSAILRKNTKNRPIKPYGNESGLMKIYQG